MEGLCIHSSVFTVAALSPCRATIQTDGWLHVCEEACAAIDSPQLDSGGLARGHELAMAQNLSKKYDKKTLKCRHPCPFILYYFIRCLAFNFITH